MMHGKNDQFKIQMYKKKRRKSTQHVYVTVILAFLFCNITQCLLKSHQKLDTNAVNKQGTSLNCKINSISTMTETSYICSYVTVRIRKLWKMVCNVARV